MSYSVPDTAATAATRTKTVQGNGDANMNVNYNGMSDSSVPLDALSGSVTMGSSYAFGPNDVLSGRNKLSFNHSMC